MPLGERAYEILMGSDLRDSAGERLKAMFPGRRFGIVTCATWALLTASLTDAEHIPGVPHTVAATGSMAWYIFLGSMLLFVRFPAKSRKFIRAISLLAATRPLATSPDRLFHAVFSPRHLSSL